MTKILPPTSWQLGHFIAMGVFTIRIFIVLTWGCINAGQKAITDEELNKPFEELKEELLTRQRRKREIKNENAVADEDEGSQCCTPPFWERLRDQFKTLWGLYLYTLLYEASAACAMGMIGFWGWDVFHDVYEGDFRESSFVVPLLVLAGIFAVWKGVHSADVVSFYSNSPTHSIQQLVDLNILSQISVSQRTQKDSGHISWLHKIQVCLLSAPHAVLVFAYIIGKYRDGVDPFVVVSFLVQYFNTVVTLINLDGFGDDLFYLEGFSAHRIAYRFCEVTSRIIVLALLYVQVSWLALVVVLVLELAAFFAYYQRLESIWGSESHFVMGAVFFLPTWSNVDLTEEGKLKRQLSESNNDLQVAYGKVYGFLQWDFIVEFLLRQKWYMSSKEKQDVATMILARVIDNTAAIIVVIVFSAAKFDCPGCESILRREREIQVTGIVLWLIIVCVLCYIVQFVLFKIVDNAARSQEEEANKPKKLHPLDEAFWNRPDPMLVQRQFKDWMSTAGVDMAKLMLKQDANMTRIYDHYEKWKEEQQRGKPTGGPAKKQKNERQKTRMERFRTYVGTRAPTAWNTAGSVDDHKEKKKAKEVERTPFRDYNINEINITGEKKFFDDDYIELDPIGEPGAFGIASKCAHKTEPSVIYVVKKILKVKFYTLDQKSRDELVETMRNEIEILGMIDHPHVVGLLEVYEDQDWLNLIMELCKGGELFEQMCEVEFEEHEVARISQHMLLGLHEIQKWDMVHLDLKPENLMWSEEDTPSNPAFLKLIDFGLARIIPRLQKHIAIRPIGTPYYMAPEIISGKCEFDRAADLWSVGNISFALMFGFPPFYTDFEELGIKAEETDKFEAAIFDMIRKGFRAEIVTDDYGPFFPDDPEVTPYCLDFIGEMMRSDVMTRATTYEALSSPFLRLHMNKNALPLSLYCSLTTVSNEKNIQIIASHVYLDRLDKYRVAETIHLFRHWVGRHKDGSRRRRIGKKRFIERLLQVTELSDEDAVKCWDAMHMRPNNPEKQYLKLEDFMLSTSFVTMRYNDERIRFVFDLLDSAKEQRLTPSHIESAIDKYPRLGDYKFVASEVVEQCDSGGRGDLLGRLRTGVNSIKFENFIEHVHPQFAQPFIFAEWLEIPNTLPFDEMEFDEILNEFEEGKVSEFLKIGKPW